MFLAMKSDLSVVVKGSRTFTNNQTGYTSFVEWVKKKVSSDSVLTFTMEATGVYYKGVAYHLFEQDFLLHVILPNQVKKYAGSLGLRSKTDTIDARILAQMGLERKLKNGNLQVDISGRSKISPGNANP